MTPFFHATVTVVENVALAERTWRLRLYCPELATAIRPGQFVMLRLPGVTDPLLGRPFALYDTFCDNRGRPSGVDVVYLVVGKMTGLLAKLQRDDSVTVWGPLGNGFPEARDAGHVALVAGGIGQTPFLACARQLLGQRGYAGAPALRMAESVSLYYGARTANLLAGVDDFREAGAVAHVATDDGSAGFHGLVTDLLATHPRPERLVGCGPEAMMGALAQLAEAWSIPCHLSLETPMACGIGACFSCVAPVKTEGGWDYRRTCVEGPVFDASDLHRHAEN